MRRNTTFARGSYVPSATLNAIQDEGVGVIPSNMGTQIAVSGGDGRFYQTEAAGILTGQFGCIDATTGVDWRERRIWGVLTRYTAANQRMGEANAWEANDPSLAISTHRFEGLTGTGGLTAALGAVVNGSPPAIIAGSFAVVVWEGATTALRMWIFATAAGLWLYNADTSTFHGEIMVWGAGEEPTAASPPPSPIPTLTDVQWLTPTTIALREATPEGPSLTQSSDTQEVSLFDMTTWRRLESSIVARATTSNATQTTCGTYTVPLNYGVSFEVSVVATKRDRSVVSGWTLLGSAGNVVGTVTQSTGSPNVSAPSNSDVVGLGWDVTADVSGTDVRIRITGEAATTIDWAVTIRTNGSTG